MRGREGTKQQSTIFRTGKREMEERIGERARERDAAISSKSKATINYFENRKERGRETGKREMEERMGGRARERVAAINNKSKTAINYLNAATTCGVPLNA